MKRDAHFYFANLGADIGRCAAAAIDNNAGRYKSSLTRAQKTLGYLRHAGRPQAYEEGLLLLRALEYARHEDRLGEFQEHLNALVVPFARRLLA